MHEGLEEEFNCIHPRSSLQNRSIINAVEGSSLILTEEGGKGFTEIANTQDKVRKAVTKGISQEEYIMATRILQKMVDNLRL